MFSVQKFNEFISSYEAAQSTVNALRRNPNVHTHTHNKIGYVYNKENKTALVLKCVTKLDQPQHVKKTIRRSVNKYDKYKRTTSVNVGKNAISYMLNNPEFTNYEIVIPIGSLDHEACIFFKKNEDLIEAIYFNPNFSVVQQGVQSSKIGKAILKSVGEDLKKIRAYYSPCGNVASMCSALVWEEIFNHVNNGSSPFANTELSLEDYNHFTTTSTYNRYRKNKKIKVQMVKMILTN